MGDPTKKDPEAPGSRGQEEPEMDNEEISQIEDEDIIIIDGENSNLQEVIDPDEGPDDGMAVDMEDMELENDEEGMAAAFMEPEREDAITIFKEHTGSVFCVNVDPMTSTMAVSGGEDDKAYVWSIKTGEKLLECTGHRDSVTCCGFSADSKFVATADMGGYIQLWKLESKQQIWSFEVSDIEWMEWHPVAPVLFVGTADGEVWMWKLPSGQCKTFQSHGSNCTVGKVMPDGKRLCAGYEDGSIKIWDLTTGAASHTFSGNTGHRGSITSIACHHDNIVIMTGSTDVTAKILNTVTGKLLSTFDCSSSASEGTDDSVEAVGFSKVHTYAATGTLGGMLTVWDMPTQSMRHQCKHEAGLVRLRWSESSPLVHTCTLDGIVNTWDAHTGETKSQFYGHQAEILDMDIARDESVIVCGSGDNTARVFTTGNPGR